ncbi:MAG: cache domain-containing protein [Clostridia bacterium]
MSQLRAHYAFALAVAIVPAGLIGIGLVGYDYYQREREQVVRNTAATARVLATAVDGELASTRAALFALASSPALGADDLAAFDAQARAALKNQSFGNIVLIDAASQQRINTLRPYGTELPAFDNPFLRRTLAEGKPVVTDLFRGPVAGRPLLAVGVPVLREGAVRYALAAGIFPERMAAVLTRSHLPPTWIAVVADSSGTIVARTHEPERFVGQKVAPGLLAHVGRESEGALDTTTLEGTGVISIFSRAPESGWTVAIGIPSVEPQRHAWLSVLRMAIAAFIMLAIALLTAVFMARRLQRS